MSAAPQEVALSAHIDEETLTGLEQQATQLAFELHQYTESLQMQVDQCASVTLQSLDANVLAAENILIEVRQTVQRSTGLLRLCQQLDQEMQGLTPLQERIRQLKHTLEVMEYAAR
ncbi:hypothetical protein IWQ61_000962 [Dispira simplex]|nr:hypothetical protein IWQ61_000962 [Dispira simplex]